MTIKPAILTTLAGALQGNARLSPGDAGVASPGLAGRAVTAGSLCCALLVLSLGLLHAAPAAAGATDTAVQFVTAANRGDYRTV